MVLGRVLLFLSSYAALWTILAISFWGTKFAWGCATLAVVSTVTLFGWLYVDRNQTGSEYTIDTVDDAGPEAAGYLASYLLPFFNVQSPGGRELAVYIGFFIVAGAIYVNSSIMRINPTLYLVGYRVLSVQDRTGRQHYLITRKQLYPGDRVRAIDKHGRVLVFKDLVRH